MAAEIMTDIGANVSIAEIQDIAAGGFSEVRITNPGIMSIAAKVHPPPLAEPNPGVYELTGIVTQLTNQTTSGWHVENFAWVVDPNGKPIAIEFELHNDAPANPGDTLSVRLTAKRHFSPTR